jgi:hypothetical protein
MTRGLDHHAECADGGAAGEPYEGRRKAAERRVRAKVLREAAKERTKDLPPPPERI